MIEDQLEASSSEDNESDDSSSSEISVYFMSLLAILVLWQFSFKISNAALTALLKILKQFFLYIGHVFELKPIHRIGDCIPLTLSTVYRNLSLKKYDFNTFVVCPSCHSIYDYSKCFEVKFGRKESKNVAMYSIPIILTFHIESHVTLLYLKPSGENEVMIWNHLRYIVINHCGNQLNS